MHYSLPAVIFPVWFTGFLDRMGLWVGTVQLPFPPQRGGDSPTSEGNSKNLTNLKREKKHSDGKEHCLKWLVKH